jgi:hypothetical protein
LTGKDFLNAVANGEVDIIREFLSILESTGTPYCIIGGLAVNAYVEPVVSLDLDIVVATGNIDIICKLAEKKGLKIEAFPHSVNLTSSKSDLRIQLQTDERYQSFISRSDSKDVLGYRMNVASVEDVLNGKVWAYMDQQRRQSKRQKDLADIMRLIEAFPNLINVIPSQIRDSLSE